MNLAEMLSYADIGQLHEMANRYRCPSQTHSKHELIQSLLVALGSNQVLESLIRESSRADLRFLNDLLFDDRPFLTPEDLLAAAARAAFDEEGKGNPRERIARFKNGGWLYSGISAQSRYLYQVPRDLKKRARLTMGRLLQESVGGAEEPEAYRDEGNLAAADLEALLRFIGEYRPEISLDGGMHRRYQQLLMSALHIQEPLLAKGGWRFGYGRACEHYPPRLALLADYARHLRWTAEEGGRLELTSAGAERLEEGKSESLLNLFSFWLRLYKGAVPNLPSLVYWISTAAAENWIEVPALQYNLDYLIKPFYYDTPESILENRILRMMLHLGMIRAGDTAAGPVIRITERGREAAAAVTAG
ncbi:hypothetical protein [Paenibacillus glufosinatiresistens]|uniref:hypothetical protein n=1 Tax=Paenibacillus glufosinatiresistens TaxID=3070657 RepID=UPI00286E6EA3|nr:hypothetical protein [Paenibacillus sp. YX.27]